MRKNNTRYEEVPLDKIKVGLRRRQNLGDVQRLASSIEHIGLAHPIRLDADYRLVCGQRRLEAYRLLNRRLIPANIYTRAMSDEDLRALEVAENHHRKDFEEFEDALDLIKLAEKTAAELREEAQGSLLAHSGPPDSDRAVVARLKEKGVEVSRTSYQRKKKRVEEVKRDPSLMDKSQGAALKAAEEREGKPKSDKIKRQFSGMPEPLPINTRAQIQKLIAEYGYKTEWEVIETAVEALLNSVQQASLEIEYLVHASEPSAIIAPKVTTSVGKPKQSFTRTIRQKGDVKR